MVSISSKIYQKILYLHPEPFRREFGDEMLSLFEECRAGQGFWHLLADALLSVVKQQIRYFAMPAPQRELLYCEIASSPNLARRLAVAGFAAGLIAGMLTGNRTKASESSTVLRPPHRIWYARCSDPSEHFSDQQTILRSPLVSERTR